MILKIENQKIELVFTTKKIVDLTKQLKEKNLEDLYFKIMNENNVEALANLIYVFAENIDTGLNDFKNIDDVYEFIDEYMKEQAKTYNDLFNEIAEAINEEGFFKTKMNKEELTQKISNPLLSLDMNEVIKASAEKAITKMAEVQFEEQDNKKIIKKG